MVLHNCLHLFQKVRVGEIVCRNVDRNGNVVPVTGLQRAHIFTDAVHHPERNVVNHPDLFG